MPADKQIWLFCLCLHLFVLSISACNSYCTISVTRLSNGKLCVILFASTPFFLFHDRICDLQVREMVHDFYGSRYASCLAQLEKLQPALKLDVHLNRYARDLSTAVSKALSLLCQCAPKPIKCMRRMTCVT